MTVLHFPRPKARIVDERTGERYKRFALLQKAVWREMDRQTMELNHLLRDFRLAISNTLGVR